MPDGRIYMLQPSFTAGEISPDVASRVDLDKYASALLQAENVFIRPYGSAYRRPGTEYCAEISDGYSVRMQEFTVDADTSYLLVFTLLKLRIYKDGNLIDTKTTPYLAYDLPKLRFAQTGDVMYIASGAHPVQMLTRTAVDTFSNLSDFTPKPGYFDDTTMTDGVTITPSATTGTVTLTASSGVFSAGQVGNWIELEQEQDAQTVTLSGSGSMSDTGTTSALTAYETGWTLTTTGTWAGTVTFQEFVGGAWVTQRSYTSQVNDSGTFTGTTQIRAGITVTAGTCNLTLTRLAWTDNTDPLNPIVHDADSATLTCSYNASTSVLAGPDGWKVISHGTWTGTFEVQYSEDNVNWKNLRQYSSKNDFNVTESGTFDEPTWIRATATISSGSIEIALSRLPYTHVGTAKITAYTDSTHVTAVMEDDLADTSAAEDWAFGSWCGAYGYPSCVTFFQDRLCFAANERQPYMVWMSKTGDYFNFSVEKVDGTITDDSAVAISFITRKDYRILHLIAHSDLLIMTEGNEWIINGAEVVTPTNVSPRVQTSRGSTDVVPELIGGQVIFVQRHGKTVRDMQYDFGTDSYDGQDLTILAKHITQDKVIKDSAYRQEPDYMCFFVLDDGTCACLTYVNEQRVYAWCRMRTQGIFLGVASVATPGYDDIYFVVGRENGYFLERLSNYRHSEYPHDYVMMDCALHGEGMEPGMTTVPVPHLKNQNVEVLANGRRIPNVKTDASGNFELEVPAVDLCVGLGYTSTWELPNIELQLKDGTLQGRRKKVSEVILRLENSLGGRVGLATNKTDVIKYDELLKEEVQLYSGEKLVTVPNVTMGGFNDKGRVVVVSDDPYPLSISSIVRALVPGG